MAWTLARHPELVVFAFRNPRKTKIMERLKLEGMKESSIKPFHGDKVLQTLMSELLTSVGATFFFETGTFRADSLIWVSKHSPPNIALFSCEVDKVYFEFAKARIGSVPSGWGRGIKIKKTGKMVRRDMRESAKGKRVE